MREYQIKVERHHEAQIHIKSELAVGSEEEFLEPTALYLILTQLYVVACLSICLQFVDFLLGKAPVRYLDDDIEDYDNGEYDGDVLNAAQQIRVR